MAAQVVDIMGNFIMGAHIYFTDATALQGSLINYLKEVRPTMFFSVPRVFEKIEDTLKLAAN